MPKVRVSHIKGMEFRGAAESGHTVIMDTSREHGGENAGIRPMELVLAAMGGCTGMDVLSILRKKRMDVTGYELNVDGKRAEEHPKVYRSISVEHVVRGRNIDPAAVERAIQLSTDKYCPVIAMLSEVADIRTSYRVIEEKSAVAGNRVVSGK